jgi:TolB-like protein/Flp pilus assembly protein TadD
MSSFFSELQRRNVFRVAVLYGIVAWVLIQIVDVVMPRLGIPEWGVTLVIVLLAIGLPIAMIFAWAFELTPEGIKRTREVDPDASVTPDTGQKLNHLIIGVLGIAVAYLLADKFFFEGATHPGSGPGQAQLGEALPLTSIAVLPFVDMSPDKDQEYFTDGISEELLNLLAKIQDFKVAGRTSSFAFKNKNEDLRIIGEKLGVATILEGSVRKQKDQIRVTAQLVKVDDGYHLWSDTYDRKLDDVFAIQDEIATEVVGALKHKLLGAEDKAVLASAPRTRNTEAYTAYLRGKHVMRVRSEENLYVALREFRHATGVDPDFALAWASVANAYTLLANYEYRSAAEVLPLARDAADKALSLDPQLSEAWAAKGLLLKQEANRSDEAIPVLEKAVALNPSDAQTLMWLGTDLNSAGRYEEARATLEQAYEIDPLFPTLLANLMLNHSAVGDREGTSRYLRELESVAPTALTTYRSQSLANWNLGQAGDAFRAVREGYDNGVFDSLTLGLLADLSLGYGDHEQAARYAVVMRQINPLSQWATATDATILYLDDREKEATDLVDDALLRQPDDPLLCLMAGTFAMLRDDRQAARSHFEADLGRPSDTDDWLIDNIDSLLSAGYLVQLYREAGEESSARALYESASQRAALESNGTFATAWSNYLQARLEAAIGDVGKMKHHLRLAVDQDGQSMFYTQWDTMFQRYIDDREVAELLGRLDANRDAVRSTLVAEGLIAGAGGGQTQ